MTTQNTQSIKTNLTLPKLPDFQPKTEGMGQVKQRLSEGLQWNVTKLGT